MVGNPRVGNNPWLGIRCGEAVGIAVVSEPPATELATEPPVTEPLTTEHPATEPTATEPLLSMCRYLLHIARRRHRFP